MLTLRGSGEGLGRCARFEWAALVSRGAFDMHTIPVWLPPLPLAIVALALFCLGILAWLRGRGGP
jgi:hypothetical protein